MTVDKDATDAAYDEVNPHQFHVGNWPDEEGALLGRMPEQSDRGPIVISNEFVDVVVTQVRSRNGVRLDIWSPRRGSRVQLDAVVLDCLSYQTPETFTDLLAERPSG
jgi:hypothetical protein